MQRKRQLQRGQGMTEYIILVALIAIVAIGAVKYFGSKTKEGFNEAASQVGGVTKDMKDAKSDNGSQGGGLPIKIN